MLAMSEGLEAAAALKSEIYNPSSQVVANANVPDYLELRKNAYNDPLPFWDAQMCIRDRSLNRASR